MDNIFASSIHYLSDSAVEEEAKKRLEEKDNGFEKQRGEWVKEQQRSDRPSQMLSNGFQTVLKISTR